MDTEEFSGGRTQIFGPVIDPAFPSKKVLTSFAAYFNHNRAYCKTYDIRAPKKALPAGDLMPVDDDLRGSLVKWGGAYVGVVLNYPQLVELAAVKKIPTKVIIGAARARQALIVNDDGLAYQPPEELHGTFFMKAGHYSYFVFDLVRMYRLGAAPVSLIEALPGAWYAAAP